LILNPFNVVNRDKIIRFVRTKPINRKFLSNVVNLN
jgi:hypothetical protein